MNLKRIAQKFMSSDFQYLDANRNWVDLPTSARFASTDRFLSNFNRPTRKRMLYSPYELDLSSVEVIRHKISLEIYLVGVSRRDSFQSKETVQLTICHLATPAESSGLCEIFTPSVKGSGDDLGWIVIEKAGETYLDLELRSTSKEPGSKEVEIGNYYGFAERTANIRKGDVVALSGTAFVVSEVSMDSGLKALRLEHKDFNFVDFTISFSTGRDFDANFKPVDSQVTRRVSGVLGTLHDSDEATPDQSDYFEVYVRKEHIGFIPKPDMKLNYQGKTYTVTSVNVEEYGNSYIIKAK